jgi:hypothetical protein
MSNPTRFPSGISTQKVTQPFGNFPLPDPVTLSCYNNDFFTYNAVDWTVTAGGAGSGIAVDGTVAGGAIKITTATSGTESLVLATAPCIFTAATSTIPGLRTWFSARVTLDATVANPDYAIGLGAGGVATFNSATDGVYFTKATGATVWSFVIKASSTATTFALPTTTVPVNSQVIQLGYYYDGTSFFIFFNNALIATVGPTGSLGAVTNLPASTVVLAPFASNSFHTATSILEIDYILAASDIGR